MRRRGLALVLVGLMVFVVAGAASAGGHIASCDGFDGNVKFDSDVIGVEGVTLAVDGVAVTLNDWVTKEGEPDEFVGFSMTFDEGSFEMAYVKA
ncbi:MAG: hypothetical protein HKN93_06785, partial [Acidimicrobiia bacterium]|nr:hypothetical protein [Acidimicrobiia bacterium]